MEGAPWLPLGPSPTDTVTMKTGGLPRPGEYLRLHPLQGNMWVMQRNMAQMIEQIKAPEKELSYEEIDNLSDAEFKTQVIRMLTELVEYGHKLEEN